MEQSRPVFVGFRNLAVAALALLALAAALAVLNRSERLDGRARIVDGDTLSLRGRAIRLAGMDAPELRQSCGPDTARYRCGERAREALRELAEGREVACRVTGRDRYRRALAVCTVEGRDLGAALVRGGWAVGYRGYAAEEREARREAAGLWAGPFERPAAWRKAQAERGR